MVDVTLILSQIEDGDPSAAEERLPLVYDELRKLAAAKLANEKPGQAIQATALVHGAFIRLVDQEAQQHWDNSRHFFAAVGEAMRRILIERARQKATQKHGGEHQRIAFSDLDVALPMAWHGVLEISVSTAENDWPFARSWLRVEKTSD